MIGATVPATCNETGYTPFVCTRCGDEKKTDLVPALGHSWNSGYVTKEATCSTTGTILYTCTRDGCGETMEKTLPKNANVHSMKTVIVPATCTEQGYTQHTCLYCRYGFNDTVVPALGHATPDDNGNCPRCGAHVQDVTRPTDPTEPTQEPEEEEEELNFFQRIIEWFRNLFANLFGRK